MKSIIFYFFIVIPITFYSCRTSVDPQKMAEVNARILEVDSTLERFASVDTAQVFRKFNELLKNVQYIQKYHTDTMKMETAQLLSDYYGLARLIEGFRKYSEIEEQLLISKEQMEDLKHDYVNDILNDEQFQEYYTVERSDFKQLQHTTREMLSNLQEFRKKFPEYNPKVDSIVKAIEIKRNSLTL